MITNKMVKRVKYLERRNTYTELQSRFLGTQEAIAVSYALLNKHPEDSVGDIARSARASLSAIANNNS